MSLSTYDRYAPYARAGLRGARTLYNLYANSTRIVGPPSLQSQVNALRKRVMYNTPQTSNSFDAGTMSINSNTSASTDWSLTSRFIGSNDYTNSVLGDFYRNTHLKLRVVPDANISTIRVIVYWSRKAGTNFSGTDFTNIPDPAAFQVLVDDSWSPTKVSNIHKYNINLKNKMTNYNQSGSTLEYGDLHIRVTGFNSGGTANSITWCSRLFIKNK